MIHIITLTSAKAKAIDNEIEYSPDEKTCFIVKNIVDFNDHKIITANRIFTVMETRVEILKAIREECDEKR